MSNTPTISLRLDLKVAEAISKRSVDRTAGIESALLRYYALVEHAQPDLGQDEWMLVADAIGAREPSGAGTLLELTVPAVEVRDQIRKNDLDVKWLLPRDAFDSASEHPTSVDVRFERFQKDAFERVTRSEAVRLASRLELDDRMPVVCAQFEEFSIERQAVAAACRRGLALVERLTGLSRVETLAVLDAVERYWRQVKREYVIEFRDGSYLGIDSAKVTSSECNVALRHARRFSTMDEANTCLVANDWILLNGGMVVEVPR